MFREGEASQPPRLAPDDSEGRGDQSDHMSQVSDSQIPQDWSPSGPRPPLRQSAIIRLDFDKRFQEPQPLRSLKSVSKAFLDTKTSSMN